MSSQEITYFFLAMSALLGLFVGATICLAAWIAIVREEVCRHEQKVSSLEFQLQCERNKGKQNLK